MGHPSFKLVDEFIARFGRERGVDIAPLDATGVTAVGRGSATVRINVLADHGVLLLYAPIRPVPRAEREAFYRRLLELSLLATSDAAFAIDKKTDTVFLRALRRLTGLDYEEFADLVGTVGRVADEWDDKLREEFPD